MHARIGLCLGSLWLAGCGATAAAPSAPPAPAAGTSPAATSQPAEPAPPAPLSETAQLRDTSFSSASGLEIVVVEQPERALTEFVLEARTPLRFEARLLLSSFALVVAPELAGSNAAAAGAIGRWLVSPQLAPRLLRRLSSQLAAPTQQQLEQARTRLAGELRVVESDPARHLDAAAALYLGASAEPNWGSAYLSGAPPVQRARELARACQRSRLLVRGPLLGAAAERELAGVPRLAAAATEPASSPLAAGQEALLAVDFGERGHVYVRRPAAPPGLGPAAALGVEQGRVEQSPASGSGELVRLSGPITVLAELLRGAEFKGQARLLVGAQAAWEQAWTESPSLWLVDFRAHRLVRAKALPSPVPVPEESPEY